MTPKASFLANESETAKRWLEVSDSALFQRACEVTMLHMVEQLDMATDPVKAVAAHHEIVGARNALRTLRNLAVQPSVIKPTPDWELTGNTPKR